MNDKYTPGQDCGCHAFSESECGCDADWTPSEVYELREELTAERALADRLAKQLESLAWLAGHECPNAAEEALAAWKEARSE